MVAAVSLFGDGDELAIIARSGVRPSKSSVYSPKHHLSPPVQRKTIRANPRAQPRIDEYQGKDRKQYTAIISARPERRALGPVQGCTGIFDDCKSLKI